MIKDNKKTFINPKHELFKWGPIDGRPIYFDGFNRAFVTFPKYYKGTWSDLIGYVKDDKVVFVADYPDLRNRGEELFNRYVLDEKKLKQAWDAWKKTVEELKQYEESANKDFAGLSDKELLQELKSWDHCHNMFWNHGFIPEVSNWGAEQILKRKLSNLHSLDHEQFVDAFEKLSAPEDISFFQVEELKLLRIKLIKDKQKQEEALKQHQKDYYWLRNSYGFTKVLDVKFFRKEMENISVKDAEKKIKDIEDYPRRTKESKEKVIMKYKLPENIVNISKKLAYCVWWQDYRKQFIFISNHISTRFAEEAAKRKGISFEDACYYMYPEQIELLEKDRKVDMKKRREGVATYYHESSDADGTLDIINGKKAGEIIKPYIDIKIDKDIKEISGMVVSKGQNKGNNGIVRAKAKIILTPRNISNMNQGDVLVAPMTSPDFIIAMRKASAIITDEGGMTSHAAIVSRELGIPCIVATKIATKVLKDGDDIEVDANKGVVRKL